MTENLDLTSNTSKVSIYWLLLATREPLLHQATLVCGGQSGMLAQKDPWTPAALVSVQLGTKLAGNLLFVTWMGMGLAGAAWASVASQWVTAAAVSVAVCRKPVRSSAWGLSVRISLSTAYPL